VSLSLSSVSGVVIEVAKHTVVVTSSLFIVLGVLSSRGLVANFVGICLCF